MSLIVFSMSNESPVISTPNMKSWHDLQVTLCLPAVQPAWAAPQPLSLWMLYYRRNGGRSGTYVAHRLSLSQPSAPINTKQYII